MLGPPRKALAGAILLVSTVFAVLAHAQSSRFDQLANAPFTNGFLSKEAIASLKDELVFQSAVQSYLWGLPVLNMYGMKDGSEKVFGKGYNILPIWKDRLNAKTLITTPNSDVIYAVPSDPHRSPNSVDYHIDRGPLRGLPSKPE
jgi:hypothetical protein